MCGYDSREGQGDPSRRVGVGSRLVTEQVPAQCLQCAFAQTLGMPLARLRKFDDLLGNNAVGEIVGKPERYASHFKRDSQNPLGFGIDFGAV